jgi:hypothetical protein
MKPSDDYIKNELKDHIRRELRYDPETRRMYWLKGGMNRLAGTMAGTITAKGEQIIPISGMMLSAAAISYYMSTGKLPEYKMGYLDKDKKNIHISNIFPLNKPRRKELAERRAAANYVVMTKESLRKHIKDWMTFDEKKIEFRWKVSFYNRKEGRLVGWVKKTSGLRVMGIQGWHVNMLQLAWLWHHGDYPKSKVYLFNEKKGATNYNMTLDRKKYLYHKRQNEPKDYVYKKSPTTLHCRRIANQFKRVDSATKEKLGLKSYDPWRMAATFEKLIRKIAPQYADTVLAIENQPFHYRGKMIE